MKLTNFESARVWKRLIGCGIALIAWLATWFAMGIAAPAQGVTTTTVQGTVYLANGQPGAGTLVVSWPAFTTAAGQAIAADSLTVTIPSDGFVSVNLAPNQGAKPAGEFYTAVYDMSDGSTSTEYWVVPAAAQATIAQVRAQVMPAAQAVQTVSKAYVDQSISELTQSLLTASGGNLSGPLFLNGDPTQPLQAADKEYVDAAAANPWPAQVVRVDELAGADFGAKLQACVNAVSASYGGTCDARNFTGNQSMGSSVTISTSNTTVLLPCATIATANQIVVTAGTRNVSLRGCALRGGSAASGSEGGTALAYSGASAMIQVGDPTYAVDTPGFALDNVAISTTGSTSASAQGLVAYRTQELNIESVYLLGNPNQTAMTLDGTGNYTGGTFLDDEISGFQTAVNAIGHQAANSATTDWVNASTFVRLHIDCPLSNGKPIAGTYGINLQQGDGNTFTGGDVEGCATALHLGPNAQNNTIVGLRNENSTNQVIADAGSSYNNWISGGTMFTGQLIDNGTRNSFLDSFHRSFNALNGDWYGSQQDATVTDHQRLGIGLGNERGREAEYQTDYGYRWETGLGDGTSGEQFYNVTDLLNNVQRLSVGQYLSATPNVVTKVVVNNGGCYSSSAAPTVAFTGGGGSGAAATANLVTTASPSCAGGYTVGSVTVTSGGSGYTSQPTLSFTGSNQTTAPNAIAEIATTGSTNNQTVINSAGTGAVVLNGSNNPGTGGVVIGSGGVNETTVATVDKAGDAQFNGTLQVNGTSQSAGAMTVRNNADAEVDYYLWPGLTTSQKGSFTYKDWNGNSEWYLLKDASNNWALNSAVGGLDSFKAYQSTNSGDTYVNASNSSGVVRVNYETGSGTGFKVYGGNSGTVYASFTGANAIAFPGLAASSGKNCLQIDDSGYVTNTGSACGSGSDPSGTASSSNSGYIAYYSGNGSSTSGMSTVPVTAGGTGASTAAQALASLGGLALTGGRLTGALNGTSASFSGAVAAATSVQAPIVETSAPPALDLRSAAFAGGAKCNGTTNESIDAALQAAINSLPSIGGVIQIISPSASWCYLANPTALTWGSVSTSGVVTFKIYGLLEIGTTFTIPLYNTPRMNFEGIGGYLNAQFQSTQDVAAIVLNSGQYVQTTLGTAVTVPTGNYVTATVTPGSMAHIYPGTALSIEDHAVCTISTVSETSTTVTAQTTGGCPIGPGGYVTVSGVANSAFNGQFLSTANDRVTGIITWTDSTTGLGSSTGGTVTGPNDDTQEEVLVKSTTSTTFTAEFMRSHAANAAVGIVAVAVLAGNNPTNISNLAIGGASGADLWYNSYLGVINNVGLGQDSGCNSADMPFPALVATGAFNTMENSAATSCNAPYSIHMYMASQQGGTSCGDMYCMQSGDWTFTNDFITDLKQDHGGQGLTMTDVVCEQAKRGCIIIDPTYSWNSAANYISLRNVGQQDVVNGSIIYQTVPWPTGNSDAPYVDMNMVSGADIPVNDYFTGYLKTNLATTNSLLNPVGLAGSVTQGSTTDTELRGEGAGFGPQDVPYATEPVLTNPANWPNPGGTECSLSQPVLGPDGAMSAGEYTTTGTGSSANLYTWTGTPAVGDVILVGVDTYVHGLVSSYTSPLGLSASTHWQFNYAPSTTSAYSATNSWSIRGDWWHRVVSEYTVTAADGTSGNITFSIPCTPNATIDYANPFFIYIPASAGIPQNEINRYRQQLLHGLVPPNWNNPGMPVTTDPISAGGYYVNTAGASNHKFSTGDLGDWTNSGVVNGDVPVWNSTAQKWMPGPQSAASPTLSSIGTDANSVLGSGGSYAAPTCATGWTCDALSGMVTFTTGASPGKSGSLFVLNLSAPRASDVACTFQPAMTYGGTAPLGFGIYEEAGTYAGTNKTSAYVYNATLTPHTQYFVSYTCGR